MNYVKLRKWYTIIVIAVEQHYLSVHLQTNAYISVARTSIVLATYSPLGFGVRTFCETYANIMADDALASQVASSTQDWLYRIKDPCLQWGLISNTRAFPMPWNDKQIYFCVSIKKFHT